MHDIKLTFENVWVHSQGTAGRYTHNNDTNIDTQAFLLPSIYQKWSDKLRQFIVADSIIPTHKRVLINGVTGQLLAAGGLCGLLG